MKKVLSILLFITIIIILTCAHQMQIRTEAFGSDKDKQKWKREHPNVRITFENKEIIQYELKD